MGSETQEQFASRLGINRPQVARYLSGRIPDPAVLMKIAQRLGVTTDWLLTGKGATALTIAEEPVTYGRTRARLIPLLTFVQAGALTSSLDPLPYAGAAEEYISASVKGDRCIALRVRGESMLPEFREKDIIVIDLEQREPQSGDYVVARVDEKEEATFKLYLKKRDGTVLKPLNDAYKEIPFVPDHRIVGKVVRLIRSF